MSHVQLLNCHVNLTVEVNETRYTWNSPRGVADTEFSVPFDMLSGKDFSNIVLKMALQAKEDFLIDKVKVEKEEAEKKAKEEAEKALAEQENPV